MIVDIDYWICQEKSAGKFLALQIVFYINYRLASSIFPRSADNSFEIFWFLNKDFYIAQMNYSWACLRSFLFWVLHQSFLSVCIRCGLLVQSYDRELYKDVLDDIESNYDSPNPYPSLKPHIGFNAKYLFNRQ